MVLNPFLQLLWHFVAHALYSGYNANSNLLALPWTCTLESVITKVNETKEGMIMDKYAITGLFGPDPDKGEEGEKEMSPVCHVKQGKKYPPFLLLNGDKD